MYGTVFNVIDNTTFNKVIVIKIKLLKELDKHGRMTGISCSKWMEEWNNFSNRLKSEIF